MRRSYCDPYCDPVASLRRHLTSKYYWACFTIDGRQFQRSTRQTNKKKALEIANKWEQPWQQKLQQAQVRRVVADIYQIVQGERLAESTTRAFLGAWIARKEIETKPNTLTKYKSVVKQFLAFLGAKADTDLLFVTSKDIADFRDEIARRLTAATANLALKILRVAFMQAFRDGVIQFSPAAQVTIISRKGARTNRRGFSIPELRRLLESADEEWRGLILCGLYTGQRLKDVATLTARNLDLERGEIRLVTNKTGRQQIIPLAAPLRRHIEEHLLASDDPKAPLFPKVFADVNATGDVRRLSAAFYELLVSAGLATERARANNGRGRSVRRETSELSFHSLRHTATSLMKNAGISPAIVQDVIGHDSAEMSAHYTHIEEHAKRKAIESMPDVTQGTGSR